MLLRLSAVLALFPLACVAFAENPKTTEKASVFDKLPDHGAPARKDKFKPLQAPADVLPQDKNLRIAFKVRYKDLETSGDFVTESGTQANYVEGGDQPWEVQNAQGKGLEFKKFGVIVNILPFIKPDTEDIVDAQLQCELSGPLAPMTSFKVPPVATFQLQDEFTAPLGKTVVLVDQPDRRVEITITEAK